jgi:hypothetical protein
MDCRGIDHVRLAYCSFKHGLFTTGRDNIRPGIFRYIFFLIAHPKNLPSP